MKSSYCRDAKGTQGFAGEISEIRPFTDPSYSKSLLISRDRPCRSYHARPDPIHANVCYLGEPRRWSRRMFHCRNRPEGPKWGSPEGLNKLSRQQKKWGLGRQPCRSTTNAEGAVTKIPKIQFISAKNATRDIARLAKVDMHIWNLLVQMRIAGA